jgi:hypothetical protein
MTILRVLYFGYISIPSFVNYSYGKMFPYPCTICIVQDILGSLGVAMAGGIHLMA